MSVNNYTEAYNAEMNLLLFEQDMDLYGKSQSERLPHLKALVAQLHQCSRSLGIEVPKSFDAKKIDFDPYLRGKLFAVRKELRDNQPITTPLLHLWDAYTTAELKEPIDQLKETAIAVKAKGVEIFPPLALSRLAVLKSMSLTDQEREQAGAALLFPSESVPPKIKKIRMQVTLASMIQNTTLFEKYGVSPQKLERLALEQLERSD